MQYISRGEKIQDLATATTCLLTGTGHQQATVEFGILDLLATSVAMSIRLFLFVRQFDLRVGFYQGCPKRGSKSGVCIHITEQDELKPFDCRYFLRKPPDYDLYIIVGHDSVRKFRADSSGTLSQMSKFSAGNKVQKTVNLYNILNIALGDIFQITH